VKAEKKAALSNATDGSGQQKPEEGVRQATIKELVRLGWREEQLRWKPEWQIPKTPHDLTKRERGQNMKHAAVLI